MLASSDTSRYNRRREVGFVQKREQSQQKNSPNTLWMCDVSAMLYAGYLFFEGQTCS
jgi:hypothetical protein